MLPTGELCYTFMETSIPNMEERYMCVTTDYNFSCIITSTTVSFEQWEPRETKNPLPPQGHFDSDSDSKDPDQQLLAKLRQEMEMLTNTVQVS